MYAAQLIKHFDTLLYDFSLCETNAPTVKLVTAGGDIVMSVVDRLDDCRGRVVPVSGTSWCMRSRRQ